LLVKGGLEQLVSEANDFLLDLLMVEDLLHRTKINIHKKGRSCSGLFFNVSKNLLLNDFNRAMIHV
jgi:hypothetical protein